MREEHNPEIASPASPKEKWELSQQAWSRFLARLDQDPEKAGKQYEELRKRLGTLFRCRGFSNPEELVDRAIDRLIRALDMGKEIRNLFAFACEVARFVALEEFREPKKIPFDAIREPTTHSPEGPEQERRVAIQSECIRCCSSVLSPADLELVNDWYQHDKSEKADHKLCRNLCLQTSLNPNHE